ncbi:MAG: alkaline phosphatase family protein [Phycisphaerales bacterium]|jgi:predicted AlkP superfamily pyrophosphatase or phosphodiesterase|nr:alkaline phosphatase family protein [Phycisphaerales bacterium]
MKKLAVINIVGLSQNHLGKHTPQITALANQCATCNMIPTLPAVTSTVQSSILTGKAPSSHGIVANGWHERKTHSTHFWRQSNSLVHGDMVWDIAKSRNAAFTSANMFWWFNMYSTVDISVTPRPLYAANGLKFPDLWTNPTPLRNTLQHELGQFPLFSFWGPNAGIESTKWIADASIRVQQLHDPTFVCIYLPHLDYPLQKFGPSHPQIEHELLRIDNEVGKLADHFSSQNYSICLLSEYGIDQVHDSVALNTLFRSKGYLAIRQERGREYLDAGKSEAFAVPDHQVAHIYVKDKTRVSEILTILQNTTGIEHIYTHDSLGELSHTRSGEIVVVAKDGFWFTHDWWEDPSCAPDYQQTVDIHRKPGYDPRELFLAKGWKGSKPRIALKLLAKKLGFSTVFDVIEIDPSVVRGSHGRLPSMGATPPILIPPTDATIVDDPLPVTDLTSLFLEWMELL